MIFKLIFFGFCIIWLSSVFMPIKEMIVFGNIGFFGALASVNAASLEDHYNKTWF